MEKGRRDAEAAGLKNVRFVLADVQTYPFERAFDFAFSRFGMMFFANPVAAMRNVRTALKPGAELMFITWRSIGDNPFFAMPKQVVSRFLPPPGENAQTCGPGPFSMANPDVVRAQLKAAGFTDASFEPIDGSVMIGRDVEQAVEFQLALGPAGEIVREAGALAEARRAEIVTALRTELGRYARADGVWMDSSSWMIRARNPA
jgi:SAM-dependent methyltransferase